jgi:hypothetical protein
MPFKLNILKVKNIIFSLICMTTLSASAQVIDYDKQVTDWLNDIYEAGVSVEDDSIIVKGESARILNDPEYKKFIYPKTYEWPVALKLIELQQLKPAFWYMINLYLINEQNKELVVKTILTYNKFLKMDKALVGAFYTYSVMDPEVGSVIDGRQQITAPHILERKLQVLKELLYYLEKFKDTDSPSSELTEKTQ